MTLYVVATVPLIIWLYILTGRGRFWWPAAERVAATQRVAPRDVVVVIPARNEAAVIATAVDSLMRQSFNGRIHVIVVDDGSTDNTAAAARAAAESAGASDRLTLLRGTALPGGWTGKLWALSQGVSASAKLRPDYLLFSDADIRHAPDSVASLVAEADTRELDLLSYMVKLSVATLAERLLIPAFVFFFFMLYPPRWAADPKRSAAAAAGGCLLIRPPALARAGGLEGIRSNIIDDCALARAVKESGGRIALHLSENNSSLRRYASAGEIGAMISRTAFAQLRHSYLVLAATLVALFMTYLLPVALLVTPDRWAAALGLLALLLMSLCYLPMVRFYRLSPLWSLALPLTALFYMSATVHSALQYSRGTGGRWKGRVQDV
ncbi:MAG: glycosyltransferase [Gammaproteobacteria bacterium]|nr:glycosyltransferase [Gammaproteobacteria bacterium]